MIISVSNQIPTLPNNLRTSATQEFSYSFVLTCDMASDVAMNRDIANGKNEYNVQVLFSVYKDISFVRINLHLRQSNKFYNICIYCFVSGSIKNHRHR